MKKASRLNTPSVNQTDGVRLSSGIISTPMARAEPAISGRRGSRSATRATFVEVTRKTTEPVASRKPTSLTSRP